MRRQEGNGIRGPALRLPVRAGAKRHSTERTGDVRLAPVSRAGAIRRANRAGANGRPRPRAIAREKGTRRQQAGGGENGTNEEDR